jgi:hypothetical protein
MLLFAGQVADLASWYLAEVTSVSAVPQLWMVTAVEVEGCKLRAQSVARFISGP